jgi:hypothetical protein
MSYLFIGSDMYLTAEDVDTLEQFVSRGNVAMLVTPTLSHRVACRLLTVCDREEYEYEAETHWDDELDLRLDSLDFPASGLYRAPYYIQHNDKDSIWWEYIYEPEWNWREIGTFNDTVTNFIQVPIGKGFVYVHTTPLVFTNVLLLDKNLLEYDQRVLSYLNDGDIYWDKAMRDFDWTTRFGGGESSFSYILAQPALRWAWYLLIALALVFIIFKAKRSQRAMPVMEQNLNTSLEFVRTMGQLYRIQGDHKRMVNMLMTQFIAHAHDRYRLPTHDEVALAQGIASKSQVPISDINRIFATHGYMSQLDVPSADDLMEFHALLQDFYSRAK